MMHALIAGLFGLLIGSFLNVCIFRLPRDLSVILPRSFCPFCEETIAVYDNIPLLSYFFLKGRCRKCAAKIPLRYPLVEALTGILFFLAVLRFGPTMPGLKMCVFSGLIVGLVFADLEERILPDEFTLGGAIVGLGFTQFVMLQPGFSALFMSETVAPRWISLAEAALAAAVTSVALWVVGFFYEKVRKREGLGFGDVKMVAMIGTFLGLMPTLLTLMAGSLLGAVLGIIYIFVKGHDAQTYELPFGTFLGVAALLVAFLS